MLEPPMYPPELLQVSWNEWGVESGVGVHGVRECWGEWEGSVGGVRGTGEMN